MMQIEKLMGKSYEAMTPIMKSQSKKIHSEMLKSTNISDSILLDSEQDKRMKEYLGKLMNLIREIVASFMNNEMVEIYDKNFTEIEIKDLLSFYKSSTGMKMIKKQPEIQKEAMQIMMANYMPNYMKKVQEMMKEIIPKMINYS